MLIGVDLGGTKIEIAALDAHGNERIRRRVPTPSHSYDAIVETVVGLVEDVERELGARGSVGIGTPGGPSFATGLMKNSNTTVLNGRALQRDLEERLARSIRIANDANCLALSEATDGAAAGAASVFAAILGTGVGGGVVIDGRLLAGRNAIAGEWGHNPLPWPAADELPGPRCYCGKDGCIETFLSGPALAREGGTGSDGRAVVAAAAAGDANAAATIDRYVDRLARAFAMVVNILDPETIVIGGGVSNVDALYGELPKRMRAYVFSDTFATPIVRAARGDSSGVRGAARLWAPSRIEAG